MALCALMATATLTSCEGALDDIFGEWSRPVKPLSIEETPVTFEAVESGTITISYEDGLTLPKPISYTKNGVSTSITASTDITVAAGDVVSFSSENSRLSDDGSGYLNILADHKVYAYGNVMSLINDEGDFSKDKTISGEQAFYRLFYANELLFNHPDKKLLLPAITLSKGCYDAMFRACYSLSKAPELPATKLTPGCYYQMFCNCTALTEAPELPATTLDGSCYTQMFYNCTSLTTAPTLPATSMTTRCYRQMFYNCTSLTTAPELPATTLAEYCYYDMFYNCTSLTTAPELPVTTLAEYCYYGMFNNCTSLTTAPALPATTLAGYCYSEMFYGCTSLTAAPALPATTLEEYCYFEMFSFCPNLTAAPALPATTLKKKCYQSMFVGCYALTETPHLPAETLANECYKNMFLNCSALTKAYVKASYDATNCEDMFTGCDDVTTSTFYTDGTGWNSANGVKNWTKAAYQ